LVPRKIARNSVTTYSYSKQRSQLIKQWAVARGMLSRIQTFIEVGDQKLNNIQVRLKKLPDIFNRYDTA
jgi:hypothetical protein